MASQVRNLLMASMLMVATACPLGAGDSCCYGTPEGKWKGNWTSCSNGHHGPLCATLRQCDATTYQARFSGAFFGVVPFTYSVPLTVTGQTPDGCTTLSGQADLPIFGEFCCTAEVTRCDFVANYNSPKDQGQFVMRRR